MKFKKHLDSIKNGLQYLVNQGYIEEFHKKTEFAGWFCYNAESKEIGFCKKPFGPVALKVSQLEKYYCLIPYRIDQFCPEPKPMGNRFFAFFFNPQQKEKDEESNRLALGMYMTMLENIYL